MYENKVIKTQYKLLDFSLYCVSDLVDPNLRNH